MKWFTPRLMNEEQWEWHKQPAISLFLSVRLRKKMISMHFIKSFCLICNVVIPSVVFFLHGERCRWGGDVEIINGKDLNEEEWKIERKERERERERKKHKWRGLFFSFSWLCFLAFVVCWNNNNERENWTNHFLGLLKRERKKNIKYKLIHRRLGDVLVLNVRDFRFGLSISCFEPWQRTR